MIVIIGGGFAGAATAWALARRGHGGRVLLLEGEPAPGRLASGLNAGLITTLLEKDSPQLEMAVRGARRLHETLGTTRCGSLRLVRDEREAADALNQARAAGVDLSAAPTRRLARSHPLIEGASSAQALICPEDGKIDPAVLVGRYLDEARESGVRVLTSSRVLGLRYSCGKLSGVETASGTHPADWVVNAAGAWAGPFAAMAGLDDLGLRSFRRHLFFSAPVAGLEPDQPFVWDMQHEVYYRVDGNRLMLCACDEEPHPPVAPEISPLSEEHLRKRLSVALPRLEGVTLERSHACLRTFAPDRRYVIGPDPRLAGLFWVAGLGGSGATASAAIGEMAAAMLVDGSAPSEPMAAFDPARLISPAPGS